DALRDKMVVIEDARYSRDYHDPEKRSITNSVQVFFKDHSCTDKVTVEFPVGHRRRRSEGIPLLVKKFEANLASRFAPQKYDAILELCANSEKLLGTPVDRFVDMFV
ncbi:MAG: 2-methylcitrate dehydratase, partial [Deltaproteobacteria bacterium]|nr:2-methylcitrate dehydratase [Deltaproteobacteria bacterium]